MLDGAFNFRDSESMKKTPMGYFFVDSLVCLKNVKIVHRRSRPSFDGVGDFFTIGSPIRPEKVKPVLIGRSFR